MPYHPVPGYSNSVVPLRLCDTVTCGYVDVECHYSIAYNNAVVCHDPATTE